MDGKQEFEVSGLTAKQDADEKKSGHLSETEDDINSVKGELVLHGLCLGIDTSNLGKVASQTFMEKPKNVIFKDPFMDLTSRTMYFVNQNEAEKFKKTLCDLGYDFAFDPEELDCRDSGNKNPKQMEDGLSDLSKNIKSKTSCSVILTRMNFYFCPMASYYLDRKRIKLSNTALETLQYLCDIGSVEEFLEAYGSHVSCGLLHFGGRIFHSISKRVPLSEIQHIAEADKREEAETEERSSFFYLQFKTNYFEESCDDNKGENSEMSRIFNTSRSPITTCGLEGDGISESFKDLKEWADFIGKKRDSWGLINRSKTGIVPIWEIILENHPEMEQEALLLFEAWKKMTKYTHTVTIKKLREAASENIHRVRRLCHLGKIDLQVQKLAEINLEETENENLLWCLMSFLRMVSKNEFEETADGTTSSQKNPWAVFVAKQQSVRQLLHQLTIHRSKYMVKFEESYRYLSSVLDEERVKLMAQAQCPLAKDIQDMLHCEYSFFKLEIEVPISKPFQEEFCDKLSNIISESFDKEAIPRIACMIREERWLGNTTLFHCHIDLYLVDLLEKGKIQQVLTLIQHPQDMYAAVFETLVSPTVLTVGHNVWKAFKNYLIKAIMTAEKTVKTISDKAQTLNDFFDLLRNELLLCGPEDTSLADALVKICFGDGSNAQILPEKMENAFQALVVGKDEFIELLERRISPEKKEDFSENLSRKVLTYIFQKHSFPTVKPCCNEFCPICKSLCIDVANHNLQERPHDAIHQPRGLVGVHHEKNLDLIATTCSESNEEGFYLDRRIDPKHHRHLLKDFSNFFICWKTPSLVKDLPLRQFIMANYNEEIAKKYGMEACKDIPRHYFHDLSDIRKHLEANLNAKNL